MVLFRWFGASTDGSHVVLVFLLHPAERSFHDIFVDLGLFGMKSLEALEALAGTLVCICACRRFTILLTVTGKSFLPSEELLHQTCCVRFHRWKETLVLTISCCSYHRSVAERMMLGSAFHMFQHEGGPSRIRAAFDFAFEVAWPRCGRAPLA